jgi:hypothetical protein
MNRDRKQANAMRSSGKHRPKPISFAVSAALATTAVLLGPAQAGSSAFGARAHSARALVLNESGSLHLTSKQGFTLNEQGSASGTVKGPIYVHLKIVSSKRVTAEVNIYPHNGSISCFGTAGYERHHSNATFSGTIAIKRGTGSYGHAYGSGLSFSGTIQRSNDAVTVRVSGRASY